MTIGSKNLAPAELDKIEDSVLVEELKKAKEELFNLRFQSATGQLESHGRLRAVKRDIARIYTIIRERELGIRAVAAELDINCGILLDTQGPAIRTGDLPVKLNLKPGQIFEFTVRGSRSEEEHSVDVNYDGLVNDIHVGDTVLVDNGVIHMKVLAKDANRVRCEVLTEGLLGSKRHINLPGVKVNLPPLTEKDHADIALGVSLDVDFVALSFCREAADILELKRVLLEHGSRARTVAKIEDQNAVRFIKDIIVASDAVMIARGDLGVELPFERVPLEQKRVIGLANRYGRPVITATQMLESMTSSRLPTRAEATDVANAILDGTENTASLAWDFDSDTEFFDYEAKYLGKSEEITPARISDEMSEKV